MGEADPPSGGRASSSFVKSGDRKLFTVELRPGETTIVSWKKLLKDGNNKGNGSNSVAEPPVNAHPALESRIAPGQPADYGGKDAPNRFSAVIEKIERLYMDKDSSGDEDLLDVPDDDQYDTEDSFIDDAELDVYFEVDNSAIKHDGFFVNKGELERLSEPPVQHNHQPKKRRRKDLMKNYGENEDGHESHKDVKLGKTMAGKAAIFPLKNSYNSSKNRVVSIDQEAKDVDKQKIGIDQSKNHRDKYRDASGSLDSSCQKYHNISAYAHAKSQAGKNSSNMDNLENSIRPKEENSRCELPDLNLPHGTCAMQATKTQSTHRKDSSSSKPKFSMLEKAIRDLEKLVAESRPPVMENEEVYNSSSAIKRRLPREVKMKLAKVARIAQASQGKVSKELINRLMSILGHLIQLRTLKRNLKSMISMGLSAKQEKDDRFQQIKNEVVEMIKMRAPSLEFKQQAGISDDFQDTGSGERGLARRKFSMDTALEEKICDLYDLFIDGLDECAGPQIRKLYAELAELWPNGYMDNHDIKRAICRAQERRRILYYKHKDQERMKKLQRVGPRQEESIRVETSSISLQQPSQERLGSKSG